jgi:hypothetical protein
MAGYGLRGMLCTDFRREQARAKLADAAGEAVETLVAELKTEGAANRIPRRRTDPRSCVGSAAAGN